MTKHSRFYNVKIDTFDQIIKKPLTFTRAYGVFDFFLINVLRVRKRSDST